MAVYAFLTIYAICRILTVLNLPRVFNIGRHFNISAIKTITRGNDFCRIINVMRTNYIWGIVNLSRFQYKRRIFN